MKNTELGVTREGVARSLRQELPRLQQDTDQDVQIQVRAAGCGCSKTLERMCSALQSALGRGW